MEYVPQEQFKGRVQIEDERFARDNKRITEIESLSRTLSDTNIKMGLILQQMKEDVDDHEKRINIMEQKPGKRWESIVEKLIWLIVAAAVGFLLAKIGVS